MRGLIAFFLVTSLFLPLPARAESCRLALVLALDVSGSVNEIEYAQQLNGLSEALNSSEVRDTILADRSNPIHLAVFEWSSQNHQFLIQPWIALDTHASIDLAVHRIRAYRKKRAGLKTALSTAMLFAGELLAQKRECWQKTIDVSGDGKNNIGPDPKQVYKLNAFADVTVNALVVSDPSPVDSALAAEEISDLDLKLYFENNVIHGPAAFSMIAYGYKDYARAMQRKLLREMSVPILGLDNTSPRPRSIFADDLTFAHKVQRLE